MKNLILSFIAFTLSCNITACLNNYNKMKEKFEWEPAASAPQNYPMEGYQIQFVYADSNRISWPLDVAGLGTGWGDESGGVAVGENQKSIPVRLDITWLSYTENQFYTGSFQLPYDTILALFKKGWPDLNYETHKHIVSSYNKIIAGMAPGGVVVVWLSGAGHQIDVGRFQAKKTIVNMNAFINRSDVKVDQDSYVKDFFGYNESQKSKENLEKNGIPYGLWDRYRERFNLRPIITYDQHIPVKTDNIFFDFYNGEEELMNAELDDRITKNVFEPRARIEKISTSWTMEREPGKPQSYQLNIHFNEAEMFKVYKEIYGNNPNQEGELKIEINRGNDQYRVFLQNKDKKIELLQAEGEILLDN
jgi:hypothetical protein